MNTMYLSALNRDWLPDNATLSDRFGLGILTTLLGMAIIFVLLAVLWAILELLKYMPSSKTVKQDAEVTSEEPKAVSVPAPSVVNNEDEFELIAVLTAAVAAKTGASPTSFRVVSFKRKK